MKNILAKLFGSAGTGIASKLGNLVDKFVQTKDEKAEFQKQMELIFIKAELDLEKEITSRHKYDMQSDSWLSKNIRPLLTIFSLALYTLFAILDGNVGEFNIANQYVDLLGQIVIMSLGFYFTSRGIEKTAKILKK
mgnify:CR=1 FL=1|jgi:hypothetical protein|tara:strand:- start:82 stop:489 length:408 start_codon:yes stop_codon:yes gene_type:complete